MSNIIDFTARRYPQLAKEFAALYKEIGPKATNAYFNAVISEAFISEIKPYIDKEMRKHGFRPANRALVSV